MKSIISRLSMLILLFAQIGLAQIPRTISYQGVLTDGTGKIVADGNYTIVYKLYEVSTAGTPLWSETQSIPVTNGMVNAVLGTVTPMNLPFDKQYWLGVTVGTGSELMPRLLLTSSAYGIRADEANRIHGFEVSVTPQPNALLPLDNTGKFPASVLTGGKIGDFVRKGTPDTSRATSASPLLLVSNLGDGDGINARGVRGVGLAGRSDSSDGITGLTVSGNKAGVFGQSTNGKGVLGRSDYNDGVVGWTGAADKSGVFGHSSTGYGVSGISDTKNGVYGSTALSSSGLDYAGVSGYSANAIGVLGKSQNGVGVSAVSVNYNGIQARSQSNTNAAIAAGNDGGGPAIYAQGGTNGIAIVSRGNLQVQSLSTQSTILELGEGLDYAERFDLSNSLDATPGTVLVIDPENPGTLTVSSAAYDQKVAGIVAGAKGLGSGVRLGGDQFDKDVALAGRVYCNVDAAYGAVTPGALLTTSPTVGYAMVVQDYAKASGAILGKAMESLPKGQKGQILVLVTLQ
jgi:hypothetical protein